jgi:beta-xylosidase
MYVIGGRFVVYFAAKRLDGQMAIGAATATNARGPYHDIGHPLVALPESIPSGIIDPTVVRDPRDGALYIYFCVQPKQIYAQRLDPSGLATVGGSTHLFTADLPWEKDHEGHAVAEGPEAVHRDGWFYLFFSGASTFDGSYAVGVARAREPMGPFEMFGGNPILRSGATWLAPGHNSHLVTGPDGADYMFFHAIRRGTEVRKKGDPLPHRLLFLDKVLWENDGWPRMRNPQASDQPEPVP